MKWDKDAEAAIKKVPFFVREKVKKRVEEYAAKKDKSLVQLNDVNELKTNFLSKGGMEKEIKGFEVSACFGRDGCPNVACSTESLVKDIEKLFEQADICGFLKNNVAGDLKFHHEFRVSVSDCPNACSRPQIVDIGIIGAALPGLSDKPCTQCGACVEACKENAVSFKPDQQMPSINMDRCLMCKQCIMVCPTGTLEKRQKGFRVMLGGRLGRHPRLAMEIPGLKTHDEVLEIVKSCIRFYKTNSKNGQRFSQILSTVDQLMKIS